MPHEATRQLLWRALSQEFAAFQDVAQTCSPAAFHRQPDQGHSIAWHVLHIVDWSRCVVQPGLNGVNPALRYAYLGFEDAEFTKSVFGPSVACITDPQDVIVNALNTVSTDTLRFIEEAPAERFSPHATWPTLTRPRAVIDGLLYHVRHTAYHRGQMQFALKHSGSLL
ncbi:DinB family protein [Deinococcus peraridilitoris]|uniref:DinB-like domain-containing protein n=1 Tax=Deinococcus peraridilitoris (strain DSM 19664 / LMG 22246 / CIP 109416 / KR-200) TaxID=937777 RepID=K9ZZU7_DEIPD|nr:DinB family protein [Deinococcus peraridilitoris]AFZ66295.1 hypothetical protein Deipe_0716 [Deinococcus peraridilitoris DSM 19664]